MSSAQSVPAGFHTVTPYLTIKGVQKAIDWYVKAFGATAGRCLKDSRGVVVYAEITIGDSPVMLCDEDEKFGTRGPESFGGSPAMLHLYVPDADGFLDRAVKAGAKLVKPLEDQFHGDRSGMIADPFGYHWFLATHVEDVSDAELKSRWASISKQMAGG
jgi:PhnB protein